MVNMAIQFLNRAILLVIKLGTASTAAVLWFRLSRKCGRKKGFIRIHVFSSQLRYEALTGPKENQ